jgi:putative DNA primase/helicase
VSGVELDRIPAELRAIARWLVWRVELREGKRTKVPYAVHGGPASTTDSRTWATFEEAVSRLKQGDVAGVGFVFADADPFVGVDLDGALAGDEAAPWAAAIVAELDSYTELSPSGRGLHVIVRGELRAGGNRRGPVEMYDRGRYFTVTGRVYAGRGTIRNRQAELDAVHARWVARPVAAVIPLRGAAALALDDDELLGRATRAKNGALFERLWRGSPEGYSSRSEADLALVSLLVFWTGGDETRVDRLVRASGLYRPKWDRADYRQATIDRALASAHNLYAPREELRARREELGPGTVEELGPGTVEELGPGTVEELGPGTVEELGPGTVEELGPGTVEELDST